MNATIRQIEMCLDEQNVTGPGKAFLLQFDPKGSILVVRFVKARDRDPELTKAEKATLINKLRTICGFQRILITQ